MAWRAYVRRFDLEHTFRFLKQTLNWTLPRVRHPGQADRWTWLAWCSPLPNSGSPDRSSQTFAFPGNAVSTGAH